MIRGEEHYDIVLDIEREDIGDAEDYDYDVDYDDGNDNNFWGEIMTFSNPTTNSFLLS